MINFANTKFIKSATSYQDAPEKNLNEILFVGRSNVGKSSLINALTKNSSLAKTSSKPGFTKLLNYFNVDNKFYLVDAPGYGYTSSGNKHIANFGKMMENYFQNPKLKLVLFLIDSRHEMSSDDKDFYQFLIENNVKHLLIATKVDKLNQKETALLNKNLKEIGINSYFKMSINDNKLVNQLRLEIEKELF